MVEADVAQGPLLQPSADEAGDNPLAGPDVDPHGQGAVAQSWAEHGGANAPAVPVAVPPGRGAMVQPLRGQAGAHPPAGPPAAGPLAPVSMGPLTVPPPATGAGARRNGARKGRKGGGKGAAYSQLTPDDHERYLAGFGKLGAYPPIRHACLLYIGCL